MATPPSATPPLPASEAHPPRTIRVLLFAGLAEALGRSHLDLVLDEGATAGTVRERVLADPRLAALRGRVRVAVGHAFAADDRPIRPDEEVALIPPVAGG